MNLFKEYRYETDNAEHDAGRRHRPVRRHETITLQTVPVPEVGPKEVLIRVETAGVAVWDEFERGGGFAERSESRPSSPTCSAPTARARSRRSGNRSVGSRRATACTPASSNPKGGFYAEYAVVKADNVSHVPAG